MNAELILTTPCDCDLETVLNRSKKFQEKWTRKVSNLQKIHPILETDETKEIDTNRYDSTGMFHGEGKTGPKSRNLSHPRTANWTTGPQNGPDTAHYGNAQVMKDK